MSKTKTTDLELLEIFLVLGRGLAERRALEPLLTYAVDAALELCDAESGYLVLLESDSTLNIRVAQHRHHSHFEIDEDQISHSIFEQVIASREPLITAEAIRDPDFQDAESVQSLQLRSVLCVPLIAHERVIGVLYVENRSEANVFEPADLKPLQYFAAQAAIAIENATLNDELEALVAARTAELEHALSELEQRWFEAVEFNRVRSELISRVTHDIRSPLAVIASTLSLLEDALANDLEKDAHELIHDALTTTMHITQLSEDLFDLTNMELGTLAINPKPTDLAEFLSENYRAARTLPWPEDVRFGLELPPNLTHVSLDKTRIRQVIMNLISNALKFTTDGHVILYAEIDRDQSVVCIGVRDTGPGIAPDQLAAIFERFKQAGTSAMRSQGVGLGLAISKELIELHHGIIWVESEPDVGSDFKFTLPLGPAVTQA